MKWQLKVTYSMWKWCYRNESKCKCNPEAYSKVCHCDFIMCEDTEVNPMMCFADWCPCSWNLPSGTSSEFRTIFASWLARYLMFHVHKTQHGVQRMKNELRFYFVLLWVQWMPDENNCEHVACGSVTIYLKIMEYFSEVEVKTIRHSLKSVASRCALFEHLSSVLMNQWSFIFICDLYLKGCCPSLCSLERTAVLAGYLKHSCWTWHLLIVTIKFEGQKWPCSSTSIKWAVQNSMPLTL